VFATTQVSALNPDQGRPPWSGLHSPSKRPKRFAEELRRAVAYPFRPITRCSLSGLTNSRAARTGSRCAKRRQRLPFSVRHLAHFLAAADLVRRVSSIDQCLTARWCKLRSWPPRPWQFPVTKSSVMNPPDARKRPTRSTNAHSTSSRGGGSISFLEASSKR